MDSAPLCYQNNYFISPLPLLSMDFSFPLAKLFILLLIQVEKGRKKIKDFVHKVTFFIPPMEKI